MDIHMRDEDLIALNEFIQFFLTRTLIHVADEDIVEWNALMNRALAVFGYQPNTYAARAQQGEEPRSGRPTIQWRSALAATSPC